MNIRHTSLSAFCLVMMATCSLAPNSHGSDADIAAATEWYQTLGFPSVKNLDYVRVTTRWEKAGIQPPYVRVTEGFLVREEPDKLTVFVCSSTPEITNRLPYRGTVITPSVIQLPRSVSGPFGAEVTVKKLDFIHLAQTATLIDTPADRIQLFAFGQACSQKGLKEKAAQYLAAAADIPDPRKLKEAFQIRLGDDALDKATRAFEDTSKDWPALLDAFAQFETRFPVHPKVSDARYYASLLRQMVMEDASHHPKPYDAMTLDDQVAECVYQLRNVSAKMWARTANLKRAGDGLETNPVNRILRLGEAAIPGLTAAMDDQRFTRQIAPGGKVYSKREVLRVGDLAKVILEKLTGEEASAGKAKKLSPDALKVISSN